MKLPSASADWLSGRSTWGASERIADVRTLRRTNRVYDRAAAIGEALLWVLALGFIVVLAVLVLRTSFEDVIFWDSTDHICVYDSNTGVIRYVDGR